MSALRKALPASVRELRVFGCQQGSGSEGVRQFIQQSYPSIKKANPDLPILIREAHGTPARGFVRFERGVEKQVSLEGISSASEIEAKIASLIV
ncbi:L51/S25/CI-B8 domain-containing protein [Sporobolomyces koalae]|uniref:L51/S25/CI-B8 domain-containing protein n=1 Tax=Sporobolomyces koalae TaxID=500713 RepID=UPI003175B308